MSYIKDTYREVSFIYSVLISLHEKYSHDLTLDDLFGAFYAQYPDVDQKIYGALFDQLVQSTISPDIATDIVNQIVNKKRALKLSELAFQVGQGLKTNDDLQEFLNKTPAIVNEDILPLTEVNTDLEELLSSHVYDQGLRWRLDCLNKSLGSLRKGDFGFIFARPETGKTTFLASEITQFLGQGNQSPIVWFNNEEDGWKVMLRIYCAFFGVSADVVLSNVKRFKTEFQEQVGKNLRFFDSAVIGKGDVERIVKKLSPCLVLYDQIDKIKGFNNDREDLRLGSIYQWARELAKGNHAAIGVCQADGHAEGIRYLTMEHVANAKTAKQAEADFILGIGRSSDPALASARFLNISKNKLLGDPDTLPEFRHGSFEVLIEPTIARYNDVIKFT